MKKIYLLIIVIFSFMNCYSQWIPLDSISQAYSCLGSNYKTFEFVSPNVAYWYWSVPSCSPSTGPSFFILRTRNSFLSEENFLSCGGTTIYGAVLGDLDFVSEDTIYYYGGSGGNDCIYTGFYRTTDAGNNWTQMPLSRPIDIKFINGHLGYGLKQDTLFRFCNDSIYFVSSINNLTLTYSKLFFLDSLNGFIFHPLNQYNSSVDTIIKTMDGGLTWSQVIIDSERTFYPTMEIMNSSIAYLHTDSGYIYETVNAGISWNKILKNDSLGYIRFLENIAYSVNSDTSGHSYYNFSNDSGNHWYSSELPAGMHPLTVKMFNDSVGYILSYSYSNDKYTILKTLNNGGIVIDSASAIPFYELDISPNPNHGFFTVTFPDEFMNKDIGLNMHDAIGKLIQQKRFTTNERKIEINMETFTKGIYIITLDNGSKIYYGKIVRN
jgi:hypothetical protein